MHWLRCPYLGTSVELTGEREEHIAARHKDLLPAYMAELLGTVEDPDFVGTRDQPQEHAFVRYWPELAGGRYVVAVTLTDVDETGATLRHWLVTAYIARRPRSWRPLWERD